MVLVRITFEVAWVGWRDTLQAMEEDAAKKGESVDFSLSNWYSDLEGGLWVDGVHEGMGDVFVRVTGDYAQVDRKDVVVR